MKNFRTVLQVLVALAFCSCRTITDRSNDVLMEKDMEYIPGCPPTLTNCTNVFWAKFVDMNYKIYTFPKPGDPKGANSGIIDIAHILYTPKDAIPLPFTLGQAILTEESKRSDIVLLQPLLVIAKDLDGHKWLISLRQQDDKVSIVRLKPVSYTPPFDNLFWVVREEPIYYGDDKRLHDYLREIKNNPNKGINGTR